MGNITLMLLFFKVVILRNVPRAAFDKIPADNWPESRISHEQPFPSLHFIKSLHSNSNGSYNSYSMEEEEGWGSQLT